VKNLSVGVSSCALLAIVANAHGNLIVNGDFEGLVTGYANGATPWVSGAWTFLHEGGVLASPAGNPGQAARLESSGLASSDPSAAQTVAGLTVGATYFLAWDVAVGVNWSGAANGPSFGVFLDTQSFSTALVLRSYASFPPSGYVHESVEFVASSTSHTFIFAGELDGRSNGAGTTGTTDVSYKLDNVSLNPVPEPGTVALAMLAGSSLVAGYRRRKARS